MPTRARIHVYKGIRADTGSPCMGLISGPGQGNWAQQTQRGGSTVIPDRPLQGRQLNKADGARPSEDPGPGHVLRTPEGRGGAESVSCGSGSFAAVALNVETLDFSIKPSQSPAAKFMGFKKQLHRGAPWSLNHSYGSRTEKPRWC